jgi:hypothetical protein
MSNYYAVADVGRALIDLLWESIGADEALKNDTGLKSESQIALSTPENLTDNDKLSVFLYQILEDTYQRNQGALAISPDKTRAPPMSVCLFYMITANTKNEQKDQILLGKVMQVFNDHRVLRAPFLQGNLAGEVLEILFNPLNIDDINKIWSVISKSKPYMLSVYYEVARLKIESIRVDEVRRTVEVHGGH